MAISERYYSISLPEGDDSVASNAGLSQLNNYFTNMDSKLASVQTKINAGTRDDFYIGKWQSSGLSASILNGAAVANADATWTELYTHGAVGAVTFNTANGHWQFVDEGIYNIYLNLRITTNTSVSTGWVSGGFKQNSIAGFMTRHNEIVSYETSQGLQHIYHFSPLWVGFGGEVGTGVDVNVALQQANNTGAACNLTTLSYIQIEYVRPV